METKRSWLFLSAGLRDEARYEKLANRPSRETGGFDVPDVRLGRSLAGRRGLSSSGTCVVWSKASTRLGQSAEWLALWVVGTSLSVLQTASEATTAQAGSQHIFQFSWKYPIPSDWQFPARIR